MVAGVGEAPVAVTWNRGRLFVSSWRDHVVQAFTLIPHGASYTADVQTLVSGGEPFRPTGMSFAPDGSLYVNDWASASYPVNGKGHIWKLTFTTPPPADADLKPTEAYLHAAQLRKSEDVKELVAAMDDVDPATAQAAQFGLSQLPAIEKIEWSSLPTSRQKIGFLAAMLWRGASTKPFIADALADADDRVRQMGVRSVTEQQITEAKDGLKKLLESQVLSTRLLRRLDDRHAQSIGWRQSRQNRLWKNRRHSSGAHALRQSHRPNQSHRIAHASTQPPKHSRRSTWREWCNRCSSRCNSEPCDI